MNKHLLRGFGIGVLFATIVLFFINKPKPITDEEIVNKAKALGMITNEELVERLSEERLAAIRDSLNAENTEDKEDKEEPEPSPAPVDIPVTDETDYEPVTVDTPVEDLDPEEEDHDHEDEEPTEPVEEPVEEEPKEEPEEEPTYVTLRITRGMSSEKVSSALFAAGLIESASDFNSYLVRNGKASVINVGEYKISYDATYEEIARLITE